MLVLRMLQLKEVEFGYARVKLSKLLQVTDEDESQLMTCIFHFTDVNLCPETYYSTGEDSSRDTCDRRLARYATC